MADITRQEHLERCKKRALEYLDHGDASSAVASMMSNLNTHPETAIDPGSVLSQLGLMAAMSGDINEARRYIVGFN